MVYFHFRLTPRVEHCYNYRFLIKTARHYGLFRETVSYRACVIRRGTNSTTTFVAFPLWLFLCGFPLWLFLCGFSSVAFPLWLFCGFSVLLQFQLLNPFSTTLSCFLQTIHRCVAVLNWEMANLTRTLENSNSWVSRDVIISLGVNSKSMLSHRRDIVFHCMC